MYFAKIYIKGEIEWIYVFLVGVITSKSDFKFIISKNFNFKDSLHISICMCELKIDETTFLKIKAYDELADFCFQNLKRGDYIFISGRINDLNEVEIEFCQKL